MGDVMGLIIGSHVSYKNDTGLVGSVKEALGYGANTFMFYTGAHQNTRRGNIDKNTVSEAYSLMKENGIDKDNVVVHAPYIVNLCNDLKFDFSVSFLKGEVDRCKELGIKYMVLHPGSSVGLERDYAIQNIIRGLNMILDGKKDIIICLETMAGKGTEVGCNFEEIKTIIDGVDNKKCIGVCMDTCHIHDAGYDLSDIDGVLDEFDRVIGLSYLKVVHINDSKNERGARKDRHENIGFGYIGFDNLISVIYNKRLEGIPMILETPYIEREYPPYKEEIEMIRNKKFNEGLKEEIINRG